METGDDRERFIRLDDEHQRLGEAAQQCAANVLVDDGKLPWTGAHALDNRLHRRAEASAQTGSLILVPVLRVKQLVAGAWG